MLDHIILQMTDMKRSMNFYKKALAPSGSLLRTLMVWCLISGNRLFRKELPRSRSGLYVLPYIN